MILLSLQGIQKSFGTNEVLRDASLVLQDGQRMGLVGVNGCGKSTLAKHMNAILLPCGGKMYAAGFDTSDESKLFDIRKHIGMVFQNPDNQIVASVVEEDVAFALENMGVPPAEMRIRVDEALKAVGMYEYREHSPSQLSGGQKQRVAIAGIIAMRPDCIVLDEPTAMLDPLGRKEVLNVLHELNRKENVTIILITHYMEEVIDADRVFVMDAGKIMMEGTPRQIFSNVEHLKELRLDVPQVTELAYELKKAGVPLPDGILTKEEFTLALKRLVMQNGD